MTQVKIGDHLLGEEGPPYIVAEMSGNHNGSLETMLRMVRAAADSGVHAVKLQTFTADTMTIDLREREFYIDDPNSLWQGKSLYELYEIAHTPWEWHEAIFRECRKLGVHCFSTPFDETAVTFLEQFDPPCYKIASFENNDHVLIRAVAKTGRPLVMSTGTATLAELDESVQVAREAGCRELILLKCTSAYPARVEDAHLRTIKTLKQRYNCEVGLSDHTLGTTVPLASIALGARFIEKHFVLSRAEATVDSEFSLEPAEFRLLCEESLRAWQALGRADFQPSAADQKSRIFKRSLYVVEDVQKGETFTSQNLRAIRPGLGLPTKFLDSFLGQKAACDLKRGTPLQAEHKEN